MLRLGVTVGVLAGLALAGPARAATLSAPSTTKLFRDAVLRVEGDAAPGTLRALVSGTPGAVCPVSPASDVAGFAVAAATGDKITVRLTARRTLVCAYRTTSDPDTGVQSATLIAERTIESVFGLPAGTGPVILTGPASTFVSLFVGPDGRTRAQSGRGFGFFSCARKRFLLPAPFSLASWAFHRTGAVRADNSSNYDAPVPPRYGGHASATIDGTLRTATKDERLTIGGVPVHARPGDTLVTAKVRFSAPGYRPCSRRTVTLRGVVETSIFG